MEARFHSTGMDGLQGLPLLKNYRVYQVTTHGHDRPIPSSPNIPTWKEFVGTMHRDNVPIPPKSTWSFEEMQGPGRIINIWFTAAPPIHFDPGHGDVSIAGVFKNPRYLGTLIPYHRFWNLLRNVWLEIYFDGEENASVQAPMGDFFGVGFGEYKHYISNYLMMTAGGYVCQFHMPFNKKAHVQLVNKNPDMIVPAFYGAVTYLRFPDSTPLEKQAYFHAKFREESPTRIGEPYLILDTQAMNRSGGAGHYVGVVLNTEGARKASRFYFLEGNTKIFVDGEDEQSLEYTGLEDYYQGAWYYTKTRNRGKTEFCAPYHGLTVKSLNRWGMAGSVLLAGIKRMKLSQYRFHPEGVPFQSSIRVTVHHGEFDEVESNFSSVAYWYQEHL
jgi:hypothetical protein